MLNESPTESIETIAQPEVLRAARELAKVLADTEEYRAFEQADQELRQDEAAQRAIREYQKRQQTLRGMIALGVLGDAERAELNRLRQEVHQQPSVVRYSDRQARLAGLCQAVGDALSRQIGMDFAAACGSGGCC